jgi:hypothetical protein
MDDVFAQQGQGWNWYSVADRAGRRLGGHATRRSSLAAYLSSRVRVHEQLRFERFDENGNGNFGFLLVRRADDLRDGKPVTRQGKGWVVCATQKIGVWSLGGAPAPRSFGSCPEHALPLSASDLTTAAARVLRFVRKTYAEMSPSLDMAGARVTETTLAPGNAKGYAARVRCGSEVQKRTALVEVRLPRVATDDRRSSLTFYASRRPGGWVVWRVIVPRVE